ncbi:hypothetical protein GGQ74_001462 [Desulfobaculum xiamenense]|uniref:Uncharacterized protein n=1 Tax=Desulfobaculum xiamenense TaxID=995050 RepID=A0A846QMX5_9BACT|nr:hypothetical protein [Desulfobaculum xiamenense]NJB67822.1 hypothetical protein [Desulfobaculum xiamenense]
MTHATARPGITPLYPKPVFETQRFLALSQATTLTRDERAELATQWERWTGKLTAVVIASPTGSRLLAWLDEEVEADIDASWPDAPRWSFLLHVLALDLLMSAAAELVPQIADNGCAPVPPPDPSVSEAIRSLGLDWADENVLGRRYAVLTPMPWRGGCPTCALTANCPRLKNARPGT